MIDIEEEKLYVSIARWRLASLILFILLLIFIAILVGVTVLKDNEIEEVRVPPCGSKFTRNIDTSEPEQPGVLSDLNSQEMKAVRDYLYAIPSLNLKRHHNFIDSSKIVGIDYMLPPKDMTIAYLDNQLGYVPSRKAKVYISRGDLNPPVVQEYFVGPLEKPLYHRLIEYKTRRNPVPFSMRPFSGIEFRSIVNVLMKRVDETLADLLKESYNASFTNCGSHCMFFNPSVASSAVTGTQDRMMWLQAEYLVEFYILHPVDLLFYVNVSGSDVSKFTINRVVYGGQHRDSLEELALDYVTGAVNKSRYAFPDYNETLFSTLNRRGEPFRKVEDQRPPKFLEPDGPRYSIEHRHIEYKDWQFDVRMATFNGPQILNIKYAGQRIAYEVALQEIAAFYSGDAPTTRMSHYIDSVASLGHKARALVPGVDCPETATYLSTRQFEDNEEGSVLSERSFCVFELNNGYPLRRHLEFYQFRGSFYGGMVDSSLVVRTILSINNYDYVIDFIFHQNGVMEAKVISTGYVLGAVYNNAERDYGFQINDRLTANMHHHLFSFKVDMDVLGTSNRYETLDIKLVNVSNSDWLNVSVATQTQLKFERNLRETERNATFQFNFDTPREHIFYNNEQKTLHGESRGYKVQMSGMSKQLLPVGMLNEKTIAWARYQMAVTRYNEEESHSSSIYSAFDALDPVVDFNKFIEDDESILDEDLVLWISLGMHHIPISEDLPLTTTPGKHLSFTLSPHNYFPEDPSMSSRDQVRVQLKDSADPKAGTLVSTYHIEEEDTCVTDPVDLDEDFEDNPRRIFDV